jgi:hypothetical protein
MQGVEYCYAVQVCDATMINSNSAAGSIKKINKR